MNAGGDGKETQKGFDRERDGHRDRDPRNCSCSADHRGLHEELIQDGGAWRAHRFAKADFTRPLGHGYERDVHNADPADHEGDHRDENQKNRHSERDIPRCLENRILDW